MKYRKKPVVIEAYQWTGDNTQTEDPMWAIEAMRDHVIDIHFKPELHLTVETLEGTMKVSQGDYIIKGVNDEIYPCNPDIFEKTYELVESKKCGFCELFDIDKGEQGICSFDGKQTHPDKQCHNDKYDAVVY